MDNSIADLDVIFPEDDVVKFKGKTDGKEYIISLFIPSAVGFLLIDNIDMIRGIFPSGKNSGKPKFSQDLIDLLSRILSEVCGNQYPEIDEMWVKKNISLTRQAYMIWKLAIPIYEFLTSSGFMEGVMPEIKKPKEKAESISPE